MLDGVKLFTSIYIPKYISENKKYAIILQRTPYSTRPYGEDQYKTSTIIRKYHKGCFSFVITFCVEFSNTNIASICLTDAV